MKWGKGLLLLTVLLLPTLSQAKQPVTKVYFDAGLIESGYTLKRGRLDLGIAANVLTAPTTVWVRTVKQPPALPDNLKALSPVYSYTIKDSAWLTQPASFKFNLPGKKYTYDRSFYYYNTGSQSWQKLASDLNRSEKYITTRWGAPQSQVVVAADMNDLFGPTKLSSFTPYGETISASAVVMDEATGEILYANHADVVRSMASMTKLMTAYVLFKQGIDLDQVATYHSSYDQIGAALRVTEGETMLMRDLMYAMVVGSANNAAYALVGNAGYTVEDFVSQMNQTAADLKLTHTTFADPSGLAVGNTTTASDYAKLMVAVLKISELATISAAPDYAFTTINTGNYHDWLNTNLLFRTSDLNITGSKTGYIDEALYCLAMRVTDHNHAVISVVMGSPTSYDRFTESERLVNWAYQNYQW